MFKIMSNYVIIIMKLGDYVVVENINEENFKLLVERQIIKNKKYEISYCYAPALGNFPKRITVSNINENDSISHEKIYGLDLINGDVKSLYLLDDAKGSTQNAFYTDDNLEYADYVIDAFNELINSNLSEFTPSAINILKEIENCVDKGSKKHAL